MAVRETSQRSKQFAYNYFEQVYARVKTLEKARDAQQPKRQPLIPRGGIVIKLESSGGDEDVQAHDSEIQAGERLIHSKHMLWE